MRKYGEASCHENECRLKIYAFLKSAGDRLRLPQLSVATAMAFYHRFFARESHENFEAFELAATCLFLAAKVEETPKKLRDVIAESFKIERGTKPTDLGEVEIARLKEQILTHERRLLVVLGFDLRVDHAHKHLLQYVKFIGGTRALAEAAWNVINDSQGTTLCLQYAPRCIAAAAASLASERLELKLPPHPPKSDGKWFSAFQVSETTLGAICQQIQLEAYQDNTNGGSSSIRASASASASASTGASASASSTGSGGVAGNSDVVTGNGGLKEERRDDMPKSPKGSTLEGTCETVKRGRCEGAVAEPPSKVRREDKHLGDGGSNPTQMKPLEQEARVVEAKSHAKCEANGQQLEDGGVGELEKGGL